MDLLAKLLALAAFIAALWALKHRRPKRKGMTVTMKETDPKENQKDA